MPALRYITQAVQLPYRHAASVAQSLANIEYLSNLKATGLLDRDATDGRDGLIEDARLTAAQVVCLNKSSKSKAVCCLCR